ncbi:ABC transporter substrate-binding protein, partial [Kitasatospora herbaricolor]|uniref:ABC transporter substrate-binding protein n=1 Tax=Kitasatospora herbaricolor TaxID=68217 RepID=UPI0036D9FE4B
MSRVDSKMRRLVAVGAAVAVALSMAACSGSGSGGSGTKTVVWSTWGTPEEIARYKDFDNQVRVGDPDIAVVLEPGAGYGDYHTKLLAQLVSGTAPDVFYIGDDKIGQFVNSNALLPLTSLMNSSASQTKPEDFAQGLFGATKKGDEIYAAPNDSNPDALWYDKAALKKAGVTDDPATLAAEGKWTTEAYLDMNKKLKKAGLTGSMFWNYWSTHYSWISSQGGKAFDDSGKFVANTDPTSVAAMDVLAKNFQNGTFVVADTLPQGAGADSIFVTHKAGFFIQGRYT